MGAQYLPQIYTTYDMRGPGSFSVTMLLMQLPGNFLVVFFQGVLQGARISTWLPNVFSITEQLILLFMIGYFWFKGSKKPVNSEEKSLLSPDRDSKHYTDVY